MDRLKRSLSFRKKKEHVPESSKPHQWQEDERKVREGTCSFQVRYLGCIEVFESRGMQVCEEAVKALKNKHSRGLWARMSLRKKRSKKKDSQQCKGKYQRAILYVSGDALRVVDEISKGLIVDQTIEKVSFCAPDRNHDKGFAYICRDGTTRRWMCHGFLALKESSRMGERLSHAVGCAFAICLEKKQKREKEAVTVSYNDKGTSFTRTGSFRQASLTERLADPQSTIVAEHIPVKEVSNPYAVQRPHATQDMLVRQGSFRGFSKLETSPFKRQLSLRLNELPSTLDRQQELSGNTNGIHHNGPSKFRQPSASPIPEASPTKENQESISEMCQQLTQGLNALTSTESFSNTAPQNVPRPQPLSAPPTQLQTSGYTATVQGRSIPLPDPIRQNNPWAATAGVTRQPSAPAPAPPQTRDRMPSDAELWLNTTASVVAPTPPPSDPYAFQRMTNGAQQQYHGAVPGYTQPPGVLSAAHQRAPHLAQVRSHSIDTADMWNQQQRGPSLRQLAQHSETSQFQAQQIHQHNGIGTQWRSTQSPPIPPRSTAMSSGVDPFDAAWAASQSSNPFQGGDNVTTTFQVNL